LMTEPGFWGLTSKDEKIVKATKKVLPQGKLCIASGANDMCFFSKLKIPAVVVGPGEKGCIHQANEYVKLDKIDKAVKIYQKIIEKYAS